MWVLWPIMFLMFIVPPVHLTAFQIKRYTMFVGQLGYNNWYVRTRLSTSADATRAKQQADVGLSFSGITTERSNRPSIDKK